MNNCLVIIYTTLLPGFFFFFFFLSLTGNSYFPGKERAGQLPWTSFVLLTSIWEETLSWAGVSSGSTPNCPQKAEFSGRLSQKPREAKRDPIPFHVTKIRQVAVKMKGRWQRKSSVSVYGEANLGLPILPCCSGNRGTQDATYIPWAPVCSRLFPRYSFRPPELNEGVCRQCFRCWRMDGGGAGRKAGVLLSSQVSS